jgi:hypothetical protein
VFLLLMIGKKYEGEMASSGSVFMSSFMNIFQFVRKTIKEEQHIDMVAE